MQHYRCNSNYKYNLGRKLEEVKPIAKVKRKEEKSVEIPHA